jgi:hypothetical protein
MTIHLAKSSKIFQTIVHKKLLKIQYNTIQLGHTQILRDSQQSCVHKEFEHRCQVESALVPTAAVFYAPDKQKDKMHQKTSGPWLSGVNKFFNVERKKEKSFKISWVRVTTKTTTALHEEDHVL